MIELDDRQLRLPTGLPRGAADTVYDVLFNGDHAWSFQLERDATQTPSDVRVAWPKALRRYLVGHAEVAVRTHGSEDVLGSAHHAFGGVEDREVSITDDDGTPLFVDKYGRLTRPLAAEASGMLDELMDEVERLLADLRVRGGVPAFVCYGTLLGAVRNGRLIGHDNDIDLGYVSAHEHPVDIMREAYRIERALNAAGWQVHRGMGARVNVRLRLSDDRVRFVDVFTAHWTEGVFYMPQDTGFRLPRTAVLPLTTVRLLGRDVPAPADYEALLAATYGADWRTPDPSFQYQTPRWLARRIVGWYGGLRGGRKGWDAFYNAHRKELPTRPSPFARWVARNHPAEHTLVDLGTGNARDAQFFARKGRHVLALDISTKVLRPTARRKNVRELSIDLGHVNLADTRQVVALGTELARAEQPVDLYGRFLLHALPRHARDNVLRLASLALRCGGHLFLEFRTPEDAGRPHRFDRTDRQYVDPDEVVADIRRRGGDILHRSEETGLAKFAGEDPHVCRIVATWRHSSVAATQRGAATADHLTTEAP